MNHSHSGNGVLVCGNKVKTRSQVIVTFGVCMCFGIGEVLLIADGSCHTGCMDTTSRGHLFHWQEPCSPCSECEKCTFWKKKVAIQFFWWDAATPDCRVHVPICIQSMQTCERIKAAFCGCHRLFFSLSTLLVHTLDGREYRCCVTRD